MIPPRYSEPDQEILVKLYRDLNFANEDLSYNPISTELTRQICNLVPGSTVLDVACCTGRNTKILSLAYPDCNIIGVDLDKEAIRLARRKFQAPNIEFQEGNVYDLPQREIAMALCNSSLHHFDNMPSAIRRMTETLKKQGALVIRDFDRTLIYNFLPEEKIHRLEALRKNYQEEKVIEELERAGAFEDPLMLTVLSWMAAYTLNEVKKVTTSLGMEILKEDITTNGKFEIRVRKTG